ncbi:MAG: TIGR01459 family HAD-type hydrolase [Pseudomonadota bacterium]
MSIPILTSARDLLANYDAVFCDVWGVVHNGATAYIEACGLLEAFRARGGTVILVTNAPRTEDVVANVLDSKNVPRAAYDAIVSSGEIAAAHVARQGYDRVHHIGPDRDLDLFKRLTAARVDLASAEAIIATGLIDDHTETGEDYRERLREPAARRLPFVCANPDLVVDVGGTMLPCAGAIAEVYEDLGGPVVWAGKPHRPAYDLAQTRADTGRGAPIDKARILAIGDAIRTDIAGAGAYGIEALFIGQGIHRDAVLRDGVLDPDAFETLVADAPYKPVAGMASLR